MEWSMKTFLENDAGVQQLSPQQKMLLEKHNQSFLEGAISIHQLSKCVEHINQWLQFFRKGHFGVTSNINSNNEEGKVDFEQYKEEPYYHSNSILINRLKDKTEGLEGVWESDGYIVGVVKEANQYIGFIIETPNKYWFKNQIKFVIQKHNSNKGFTASYYMKDHTRNEFDQVKLYGNNYLTTGFVLWKRITPHTDNAIAKAFKKDFDYLAQASPSLQVLSNKTLLLRVPSFNNKWKIALDSILLRYEKELHTYSNLIIDLRNNSGGSDDTFENIIPLLYTNKIKQIGVEYFSGPQNIQIMNDIIKDPESEEDWVTWAKYLKQEMKNNPGKFVEDNESSGENYYQKLDTIYPNPKNVALLINENCGSSTEEFILAARQSRKVKLYGTTTYGALDVSNIYQVVSPNEQVALYYALTRSKRIPDFQIDNTGIQPDYFLDSSTPIYKWISYVTDLLESN
jgi:hypothetical protein